MATVPRLRQYYEGATTSCPRMSFGLLIRQPAPRVPGRGSCPPWGAPVAVQARRRTGVWIFMLAIPFPASLPTGKSRISQVPWRSIPVTLRRSTTPDDPLRLANSGASGAAPTRLTMKASSFTDFEAARRLHHLLSTLHDGRYRTPCKTRFRLAGCAFAGRESTPLDRYERFQLISSSSPGLSLAQYAYDCLQVSLSTR